MSDKPSCRFCGGVDLKSWAGKYLRCNDCLYICSDPLPSEGELAAHYARYHDKNHQASEEKNQARLISYRQELNWLKPRVVLSSGAKVFDFGGSGGYFLDELGSAYGSLELDVSADDLAPDAAKVLVEKGYYQAFDKVRDQSLDLLILRGVLEHVVDFRSLIRKLSSKLVRGGHFFITATPDSSCTIANIYRDKWVQHHYPSHFQHFSATHVDILMGESRLVISDTVDLYKDSIYRKGNDDSSWLNAVDGGSVFEPHAYWGSMMTRLYIKL